MAISTLTQKFKVVVKKKRLRDLNVTERAKLLQKIYRIGK